MYPRNKFLKNPTSKICTGVHVLTGPRRKDLVKKILKELRRYPQGIWIRKLARILDELLMTVHKYVTVNEKGYPGEQVEVVNQLPPELGGHIMIRLKSEKNKTFI